MRGISLAESRELDVRMIATQPHIGGAESKQGARLCGRKMDLLVVEDSPTDQLVMQTRLRRAFPKARIHLAQEQDQLRRFLQLESCDVVITDYWLGWSDGLSVLQRVRDRWPRARVIILTGNGGEEVVAGGLKYGLFYYLQKPEGFNDLAAVTQSALDSKDREDALQLAEMIFNVVPEGLHCVDADGRIAGANESARRLLGYHGNEMVGRNIESIVPPELRAETLELHARAFAGETIPSFLTARIRSDGSRITVAMTIVPSPTAEGMVAHIVCIARQIVEGNSATNQSRPVSAIRAAIPKTLAV
jgi:PAS domain S-box-containing protein